jgi:hypothetical protein
MALRLVVGFAKCYQSCWSKEYISPVHLSPFELSSASNTALTDQEIILLILAYYGYPGPDVTAVIIYVRVSAPIVLWLLEESNESPHIICFGHINVQIKDSYSSSSNFCASGNHQNPEDMMKCRNKWRASNVLNYSSVIVEITNTMHLFVPILYCIYWLLHVSAAACHHQGAS